MPEENWVVINVCRDRNIWIHAYTATSWVEKWAKLQYITHSLAYIYICIQHFKYLVSHKYVFGLSKVTQYLRFPSHVLIWTAHTHKTKKHPLVIWINHTAHERESMFMFHLWSREVTSSITFHLKPPLLHCRALPATYSQPHYREIWSIFYTKSGSGSNIEGLLWPFLYVVIYIHSVFTAAIHSAQSSVPER